MYVGIIGCKITSLRGLSMEEITTLNVRKNSEAESLFQL